MSDKAIWDKKALLWASWNANERKIEWYSIDEKGNRVYTKQKMTNKKGERIE